MKIRYYCLLLAITCFLLLFFACGTTDTIESTEAQLTQRLWQSLMDYNLELAVAEQIFKETTNQASELLSSGETTTLEYRGRVYQAILVYAHTIKFLDNKPKYAELNSFMWHGIGDGKPPQLAHCIPEFEADEERAEVEYELYLEDYIAGHLFVVDEFCQHLNTKAKELGIELSYEPLL